MMFSAHEMLYTVFKMILDLKFRMEIQLNIIPVDNLVFIVLQGLFLHDQEVQDVNKLVTETIQQENRYTYMFYRLF